MAKRIALFPGSFDPFTKGHEDIVLRGLILFDEIRIALGYNTQKSSRYFEINKMIDLIQSAFEKYPNIKVVKFSELTAEFARKNGARFLLRGLGPRIWAREYISQVNRQLFLIKICFLVPLRSWRINVYR
jgi:pantetheine-phosphate adenylyltransferase